MSTHVLIVTILMYASYALTIALIGMLLNQLVIRHRRRYWERRKISQAFGSDFMNVLLQRENIGTFVTGVYQRSKAAAVGFHILHVPHVVVRAPALIRRVLVADFERFHDRTIASDVRADPIAARFLFLAKQPTWRHVRQKMTPVFTATKLRAMSALIARSGGDLLAYIDAHHLEGPLEVKEVVAKFTTDVITSCAFGVDANCFVDAASPFREAGRKIFEPTLVSSVRFTCYFLLPLAVTLFRLPFIDRAAMRFLGDAFLETIAHRESPAGQPRGDLIDIIIELKKAKRLEADIAFEDDQVVAQAVQYFTAGFETTSATISFALYELALHPDIQQQVRHSVRDLTENGGEINYDTMLQQHLMSRVIQETLRKYPTLPFLDRRCNEDFITDEGMMITKGTPLFIASMGMHYDEQYYPDPHKFDPDRFLPENVKKRPAFVYLPFGQGPHNCIGERFALNTVKICLAQLLLKYSVEPCENTPIPIVFSPKSFVLIASDGIPLIFRKL